MKLILKMDSALISASFDHNNIQKDVPFEISVTFLNIPTPPDCILFEPQVLGSCNGVLCLSFPTCCMLWNPSTRTHHVIPNEPPCENGITVHGLGYDEVNDDYKLVRIVQFVPRGGNDRHVAGPFNSQIWVYSLNSGSWEMVSENYWFIPSVGFTDVFLEGCLHFKMQSKTMRYRIVALDVSKSKDCFKLITEPDCVDEHSIFDLGVLDGCLCMVLKKNREVETFQVLEMKEYGSGDSWVELFRFEMNGGPEWMRPITYVGNENKKALLMEGDGQELYFVDAESHQQVSIDGNSKTFTEVCVLAEGQRVLDNADASLPSNVEMPSERKT